MLYCILQYDIKEEKKYKKTWYAFIWAYLTIISGLSYRLGGDGMVYVWQYPMYTTYDGFSLEALTSYSNRLPGWVALVKCCKLISDEYWVFKLIHAIVVNSLIGYFVKYNAKHIFTTTLFYFVLMYFDLNFQLLRQVVAMGLFLYGIKYIRNNQLIKYYIINVLAILFHESALIGLVFPLMSLVKINKISLPIWLSFVCILYIFGATVFSNLLVYASTFMMEKAAYYSFDMESPSVLSMIFNITLSAIIPLIVIAHQREKCTVVNLGAVLYGLCYIVGCNVPIFYRFTYFYQIFFYIFYVDLIYSLSKYGFSFFYNNSHKIVKQFKFVYLVLIVAFLIFRGRVYFSTYGDTNMPNWVQYYPYSSILSKDTNDLREEFIRRL